MPAQKNVTKIVALSQLAGFAHDVRKVLAFAQIPPGEMPAVCRTHLIARCVGCRVLADPELIASLLLDDPDDAAPVKPRLARLRHGFCVEVGCNAAFYEFTCTPRAGVAWEKIEITPTETPSPTTPERHLVGAASRAAFDIAKDFVRRQFSWRVLAAATLFAALLLYRHWIDGGSIPYLREAREFKSYELPAEDPPDPAEELK